ncbi:MAG TPA: hypothetical protein DFR83_10475, partial [Deltaproteobacteria bacterium]|nr:hypothetical protein [Deltaproteobacteria bacterium]
AASGDASCAGVAGAFCAGSVFGGGVEPASRREPGFRTLPCDAGPFTCGDRAVPRLFLEGLFRLLG